jgi:beta-galactosidase
MVKILRRAENGGVGELVDNWSPTDAYTYDDARIEAYSNADEVELFLNGESQGTKTKPQDDSPRTWNVTFAKGSLRAVARNKGQVVASDELKTAGAPARIELTTSKPALAASWDDAAFVTARVVDTDGVTVPYGSTNITFSVGGKGMLAAVDNGSVTSQQSYQGNRCIVARGQCMAVVKATAAGGKITLKASADGLADGALALDTVSAGGRP